MLGFNDDQGFVWLCFLNNRIFLFNGFINTPGRKACLTYEKVIGFAVMYWQVVLTIKSNPRSHAVIINSLNEGMGRLCSLLRCSCNRTDLTVFHLYLYLHSTFKYHIYSKSSLVGFLIFVQNITKLACHDLPYNIYFKLAHYHICAVTEFN